MQLHKIDATDEGVIVDVTTGAVIRVVPGQSDIRYGHLFPGDLTDEDALSYTEIHGTPLYHEESRR